MFKDQESSNPADQRQGGREQSNSGRNYPQSTFTEEQSDALRELLLAELRDIYWAEQALVDAIPKMAEKASSEELKQALTNHLNETRQHVARLEKVFEALGEEAEAEECEAMAGLIEEAEDLVSEMPQDMVRDAAIIASAQKIEHYEIATYGTLCAFAEILGETDVVQHLEETLEEEKSADQTLTDIALSHVNPEAAGKRQSGRRENTGTHREQGHDNPRGMKKEAGQSMDQDMLEEDDTDADQDVQRDEPINPKTSQ
jgi:ferritin-like metal-binding protein YciE